MSERNSFGVVLLGAGASSRMGSPKLLLSWSKGTVLEHLHETWRALGVGQIAIICARDNGELTDELNRLGFSSNDRIFNPQPELGMFSSVQSAAKWNGWKSSLTRWIITLGDQPHVCTGTLQSLLEFSDNYASAICQPSRNGRPRHPVILPKEIFRELATASSPTLKDFLNAHAAERRLIEIDDAGLDLDLDSPADYEKARRLFCG